MVGRRTPIDANMRGRPLLPLAAHCLTQLCFARTLSCSLYWRSSSRPWSVYLMVYIFHASDNLYVHRLCLTAFVRDVIRLLSELQYAPPDDRVYLLAQGIESVFFTRFICRRDGGLAAAPRRHSISKSKHNYSA